ncbi:MAG: dihydrofolate reductase [Hyphomicrobiaceae bacterium]|nr:dihydrofolate reductase [Hyphomicrobiaceae bacterium]
MSAAVPVIIVAAVARNRVIGRGNELVWRLPSDLRHFKAVTLGKPVVMGRKTFQSIGRALPGRPNIVVSRDAGFAAEGIETAPDLATALARARAVAAASGADAVAVIGGGEIYAQAMGLADRLEITEVDLAPEGDTLFPAIDPRLWREVARLEGIRGERDEAAFSFVSFERRRDGAI